MYSFSVRREEFGRALPFSKCLIAESQLGKFSSDNQVFEMEYKAICAYGFKELFSSTNRTLSDIVYKINEFFDITNHAKFERRTKHSRSIKFT